MEDILTGPPLSANFSKDLDKSLGNYILNYIQKTEDRVYMINGETNEQLRLHQLAEKSSNLAIHLQSLGCNPGINVAIYSENCLEYIIAQLGITLSGATMTAFNNMYTLDELNQLIGLVKPTIVFCSHQNYQKAKEIQKNNSFISYLILLNAYETPDANTLIFHNLIQKSSRKLVEPPHDLEATAVILFSSGTTGLPKGVMTNHRNLLYGMHMMKIHDLIHFEGQYVLCSLPMFHGFGMVINLICITFGLTLIFLRKYKAELYWSLIEKYKVQSLIAVPPMLVSFLKCGMEKQYDASSLKHILCGAAPLRINTEEQIMQKLNLKRLQQIYGMTEAIFGLTIKLRTSSKSGTCGSVIPGSHAKVICLETNKTLGARQIGELCFKGPCIMKGYLNNTQATSDTIHDEWLHTGDLGYYDQDGEFFVVDRLKDLIKYNAYQVAPAELEDILIKHPAVKGVGVVGIPDESVGELPKAFVVLQPGLNTSEKELQQYVAGKVSPQKWLRGGVTFINEIPKNPSGKILRKKLREMNGSQLKI